MFLPEENRRGIIASFSSGFPIVRGILSRTRVSLFGWPFVPVPGLQLDRFFSCCCCYCIGGFPVEQWARLFVLVSVVILGIASY